MKSPYDVLGVDREATTEQIKDAFRRLAKIMHPDLNFGEDKGFQDISMAYDMLSDDEKRRAYDSGMYTNATVPGSVDDVALHYLALLFENTFMEMLNYSRTDMDIVKIVKDKTISNINACDKKKQDLKNDIVVLLKQKDRIHVKEGSIMSAILSVFDGMIMDAENDILSAARERMAYKKALELLKDISWGEPIVKYIPVSFPSSTGKTDDNFYGKLREMEKLMGDDA